MGELINLALYAEDERVRSVCCVAVLDRAYGRPREAQEEGGLEARIAAMTREERRARMAELLAPMIESEREEQNTIEGEAAGAPPVAAITIACLFIDMLTPLSTTFAVVCWRSVAVR
jgi:hypothetical protein